MNCIISPVYSNFLATNTILVDQASSGRLTFSRLLGGSPLYEVFYVNQVLEHVRVCQNGHFYCMQCRWYQ